MTFKCKGCGWTHDTGSFYETREDMQKVNTHIDSCKKLAKKRAEEKAEKEAIGDVV